MSDLTPYNNEAPKKNLLFVTQLVYILHGLSIVIGLMTGATIISAFLFGWPSIAAVILNYIMAPDARGTFLQSHFSWQIRTFWYGMIWTVLVAIVGVLLTPFVIGPIIWLIGFVVLGIWVAYRIVVGWLRLRQYRPVFSDY
ncbi:putative uncharacterized protein [Sutterella sp. CAG:521]|nr:putative uncharacterized protein [Sutterella sp. CAG:521]